MPTRPGSPGSPRAYFRAPPAGFFEREEATADYRTEHGIPKPKNPKKDCPRMGSKVCQLHQKRSSCTHESSVRSIRPAVSVTVSVVLQVC